nr:MAG TPA: hypothetical protein [Caudoviricetes sp.]
MTYPFYIIFCDKIFGYIAKYDISLHQQKEQ